MLIGPIRKTFKQRPNIIKAADCDNHSENCKNSKARKEKE
jgi:hypothetical protein